MRISAKRFSVMILSCIAVTFLVGSGCPPAPVGGSCGGIDSACWPGLDCRYPEGNCRSSIEFGECFMPPTLCPQYLDPVCGCDGQTYDNECRAYAAGQSIAVRGECPDIVGRECSGVQDLPCDEDEYCHFFYGSCGEAHQLGACEVIPETCNDVSNQVCGCDGRTYSNACEASASGVSVASEGECP